MVGGGIRLAMQLGCWSAAVWCSFGSVKIMSAPMAPDPKLCPHGLCHNILFLFFVENSRLPANSEKDILSNGGR